MAKRFSPAAAHALKEALSSIYWFKRDLKSFLFQIVPDRALLAQIDWDGYKRQFTSELVDRLCDPDYENPAVLTTLCYEVCNFRSFAHLERLEDGPARAKAACKAVDALREFLEPHDEIKREQDEIEERRKRYQEKIAENSAFRKSLDELKTCFGALVVMDDPRGRGFELEKLMCRLFDIHDLDPKSSFRVVGEQIDGAFSYDGTDYLLEARWQKLPVDRASLDAFDAKIRRKLENTLGLFVSINGFSKESVEAYSRNRANMILFDGADLMAVLERRVDLVELLLRKKRHASQTGNVFLPVAVMLSS